MSARSKGGDEGGVQLPVDRVGHLVADVLGVAHPLGDHRAAGLVGAEKLGEQGGPDDQIVRGFGEQVVEAGLLRGQTQAHRVLRAGFTGGLSRVPAPAIRGDGGGLVGVAVRRPVMERWPGNR